MRARLYRLNFYWFTVGIVFGIGWRWNREDGS